MGGLGWLVVTSWCPCQQRPSDYGIPMDVEMAYVQDSFLTNDILHEMVSSLPGGAGGGCSGHGRTQQTRAPVRRFCRKSLVALRIKSRVLAAAPLVPLLTHLAS